VGSSEVQQRGTGLVAPAERRGRAVVLECRPHTCCVTTRERRSEHLERASPLLDVRIELGNGQQHRTVRALLIVAAAVQLVQLEIGRKDLL
jgi:hypothetical protein